MSIRELGDRLIQWSAPLEIFWVSAWSESTLNAGTSDVRICVFVEGDQYILETEERNGGAVFVMSSGDQTDIERYLVDSYGPQVRAALIPGAPALTAAPYLAPAPTGSTIPEGFTLTPSSDHPIRYVLSRPGSADDHVITFGARYEAEAFSEFAAIPVEEMKVRWMSAVPAERHPPAGPM